MNFKIFLQKTSNIMAENRLLKFVVILIGVITLINSVMIQRAINLQRIVLIPPGLNSKVETTGYELSDEYLRQMTQYIQNAAFIYTPASCRKNFNSLLSLFAADAYPSAEKTFYELATKVEMANITSAFFMDPKIVLDPAHKTIEITGLSRKYKEHLLVSEGMVNYSIEYRVTEGKFQLVSIKEKEKS